MAREKARPNQQLTFLRTYSLHLSLKTVLPEIDSRRAGGPSSPNELRVCRGVARRT